MQLLSKQNQVQTLAQAPCPQVDYERKEEMAEAWKAYKGKFPRPLKVENNEPDDNVITNRCAPIVEKGVSFLFGKTVKIEATDETSEPDTKKQEYLDGFWGDDDDRMTLFAKMGINGGSFGQVFLKIIPAQGNMKYPRIVNLDPRLIRIVTDPEDCELHLAYVIEYPGTNDLQKRQVIARVDPNSDLSIVGNYDLEDMWTITNYVRRGTLGSWIQVGEVEEWPYPFAPIQTCQNLPNPNEAWGTPDLPPEIIDLNKSLNFTQSNISRILKHFADPKIWAKGVDAGEMQMAVGHILCLPSVESDIGAVEMQSDLSASRSFAADLRSDMDEQSRVPAVAQGRLQDMPHGDISGIALQLMFQPLLEKTEQKRRLYGKLIRMMSRIALVLGGFIGLEEYEDYPIGLRWQDILPVDKFKLAQTAGLLKGLGISTNTLQSELGYDPDEEAEKRAAEAEQNAALYGLPTPLEQQQAQSSQQDQQQPMMAGGSSEQA